MCVSLNVTICYCACMCRVNDVCVTACFEHTVLEYKLFCLYCYWILVFVCIILYIIQWSSCCFCYSLKCHYIGIKLFWYISFICCWYLLSFNCLLCKLLYGQYGVFVKLNTHTTRHVCLPTQLNTHKLSQI